MQFEPVSLVFYCLGFIIPTIMLLYSFGHIVYVIGEYNENNQTKLSKPMPVMILLLLLRLFTLGFAQFINYHILFDDNLSNHPLMLFTVIMWGFLISNDCVIDNKVLKYLVNPKIKISFKDYIRYNLRKIFTRIPAVFYFLGISMFILTIISVGNIFVSNNNYIFVLSLFLFLHIWINYRILKYLY